MFSVLLAAAHCITQSGTAGKFTSQFILEPQDRMYLLVTMSLVCGKRGMTDHSAVFQHRRGREMRASSMNKEIAFEPKTLWVGVLVTCAMFTYGYSLGDVSLLPLAAGSLGAGFFAQYIALILVEPLARFKNAVYAEGVDRGAARSDMVSEYLWMVVGGFLGLVLVAAGIWDAWHNSTQSFLHRHPALSLALLVFWVLLMVLGSSGVLKRRRERNKLKTIDLSKSRELSLK